MARVENSTHFARALLGTENMISVAFSSTNYSHTTVRGFAGSSTANNAAVLPTLGNTGMKFNSSRWTRSGAEKGLSVFDMKGAMEAIQNGPDDIAKKRAHPAALAHAARVARAQQQSASLWGFKLLPDLTPGRAFMWGTILAVYAVGATTVITARALDINSVDDVKEKMQLAFAPYKQALTSAAGSTRSQIELKESPEFIQQMQSLGQTLRRNLTGAAEL